MGRAIVRHPKLFLFDEPLSNLDAKLRVQMRAEIRRLQRRLGVTSLYVTHDQVEAMTLGDRLLVLHQGRPAQLATPLEVFERPADTYVAGFIGAPAMNFLPATLARDGSAAQLAAGPLLPFADGRREGPDGRALTIGIRPEHLVPGPGRPDAGRGADRAARLRDPGARPPAGRSRRDHGGEAGRPRSGRRAIAGGRAAGAYARVRLGVGQAADPLEAENPPVRLAAAQSAD